jgi:hypothetical protein
VDQQAPPIGLADEVLEHLLGDLEVADHAGAHGPDRPDVAGRAADHAVGLLADLQDLARSAPVEDGDDGGLVEHDAPALHIDQGVGGPQIDRHVAGACTKPLREHRFSILAAPRATVFGRKHSK